MNSRTPYKISLYYCVWDKSINLCAWLRINLVNFVLLFIFPLCCCWVILFLMTLLWLLGSLIFAIIFVIHCLPVVMF